MTDSDLTDIVNKNFDSRPGCIIRDLNLRRPVILKTASYGYFGPNDPDFTWEAPKKLDTELQMRFLVRDSTRFTTVE